MKLNSPGPVVLCAHKTRVHIDLPASASFVRRVLTACQLPDSLYHHVNSHETLSALSADEPFKNGQMDGASVFFPASDRL